MAGSDDSQSSETGRVDSQDDFAELERLIREAPEPHEGKQTLEEWLDEQEEAESDRLDGSGSGDSPSDP